MKALTCFPDHVFEYHGDYLVFNIPSLSVLKVDGLAYAFLQGREAGQSEEEAVSALRGRWSDREIEQMLGEVALLQERGALGGTVQVEDENDYERLVRNYVRWPTKGIELFLGEACNLRCRYCYAAANQALSRGLMPWEVAKEAIHFAFRRNRNLRRVIFTFFGGEPLLNREVLEASVQYARRLGRRHNKRVLFAITTNGTLLDEEFIALMKRHRFSVTLSLDGPAEVQDRMRPFADGRGSFERVIANARRMKEQGLNFLVRSTVTNACLDKVGIIDFFEGEGFKSIKLTAAEGTTSGRSPYDVAPADLAVLQAQEDRLAARVLERLGQGSRNSFHNPYAEKLHDLHRRKAGPLLPCGLTRAVTTVGIDGKLYPCHRYVGMERYVMGDVSTGVDREKQAEILRNYFRIKQHCENCWARSVCNLACPWYFSCADGSSRPPDPARCREAQREAERLLWLYSRICVDHPDYFQKKPRGSGA